MGHRVDPELAVNLLGYVEDRSSIYEAIICHELDYPQISVKQIAGKNGYDLLIVTIDVLHETNMADICKATMSKKLSSFLSALNDSQASKDLDIFVEQFLVNFSGVYSEKFDV